MMNFSRRALVLASLLTGLSGSTAFAAGSPVGTWIDHSGEGAVEISDCNGKLCGKVVWLKSAANNETCNLQVIGNAKASAGGKWDGGWIYDPENKAQYDVELTPMGDKLKVLGYAGVKLFGETMMWTRAPGDLKRCDLKDEIKAVPAVPAPVVVPAQRQEAAVKPAEPRNADPAPVPQTAPVPAPAAQPAPDMKKPPVVASKKFSLDDLKLDDLDLDEVKIRNDKGKCSVAIKDVGTFKFDCD